MEYLRAILAELLKIRRARAFVLATAAPLAVTALIFAAMLFASSERHITDVWSFYLRGIVGSWSLIVLPFYVALLLSLLASIDHSAGAWKVLFAQPVSRPPLYLAKFGVALLLFAWSQIVLGASALISGFFFWKLRPHFGDFHRGPDIPNLVIALAFAFLAGLLIAAIHLWLSMRTANFALSLGVVILAQMATILGIHNRRLQTYWPWLYPFDAVQRLGIHSLVTAPHIIAISVAGSIVITLLALWDFTFGEAL